MRAVARHDAAMSSSSAELTAWRNAAAEAQAMLPRGATPRRAYVLEPSPPAMEAPPYFADDPATPGNGCPGDHAGRPAPDGLAGTETVTPTSAGDVTWQELAGTDGDLADFARDRWLGPWRRLGSLPEGYLRGLQDAHRLAYAVVAEARRAANGKFGLRYTAGGFGTPFFSRDDRDTQVRVVAGQIVLQCGTEVSAAAIGSLADAAAHCGVEPGTEAAEPAPADGWRELLWTPTDGPWGLVRVRVLVPRGAPADTRARGCRPTQLWPGVRSRGGSDRR